MIRLDPELGDTRPESSKKFILCKDSFFCKGIEKRGFPCIGISHDPDGEEIFSFSIFSMERSRAFVGLEFLMDFSLFLSEMALHDLSIGLTLSLRIFRATTLTRELHPHTIDTRSHMLHRSQLDLKLRLW